MRPGLCSFGIHIASGKASHKTVVLMASPDESVRKLRLKNKKFDVKPPCGPKTYEPIRSFCPVGFELCVMEGIPLRAVHSVMPVMAFIDYPCVQSTHLRVLLLLGYPTAFKTILYK